jgi:hypothetical protein
MADELSYMNTIKKNINPSESFTYIVAVSFIGGGNLIV